LIKIFYIVTENILNISYHFKLAVLKIPGEKNVSQKKEICLNKNIKQEQLFSKLIIIRQVSRAPHQHIKMVRM